MAVVARPRFDTDENVEEYFQDYMIKSSKVNEQGKDRQSKNGSL